MPIRAVLWDIDDTLFDYTGADRTGLARHLAQEGIAERYGSPAEALARWRHITELHWARFGSGEVTFDGQRRDRVRDFLGAPRLTDEEAEVWFGRYVAHYRAAWVVFPDVVPVLDALAAGYRHGVLSNSSVANQDPKLRALGLRERFEVLVCAAELGISKPEARAFLAACEALGLPPHEVAYVGDQPEIDARGARDAGLTAFWLDRAGGAGPTPSGVHRIAGLARLPELLARDTRFGARSGIR
ncbi:HAD family hydrolase [Streptomyces sp. CJ_13]|uniref:HAD family hydrolase n=1 Tax=Streptomyces TaxID=1883 RepID=UPI000F3A95C6|nr:MULTISPECIES: HAD family hydrolase [unclassified Streptomyces]AYV30153.1 Pyrimidine 5'-nucleotidase YjjG [Streptomyces sp. ADI95-16]MBT1187600.1 HAD family hydrolase [Streptomyces sp. CJ_13]